MFTGEWLGVNFKCFTNIGWHEFTPYPYPSQHIRTHLQTHLYNNTTAFRPCYIRAYTDAKDIMPDTGEVVAGIRSFR